MKNYLILLLSFVFVSSAWAKIPPQPEKCPSVASILQNEFLLAQKLSDGTYGAVQINHYDTNENWAFVVVQITAASAQEAKAKAKDALSSLTFLSGPGYFAQNNIWGCVYRVDAGYPVVAITPIPAEGLGTTHLLH